MLSPHPTFKKKIIKNYLDKLSSKFNIEIYNNISTNDLLSISDLVICSMSTVAYEAIFYNVLSCRIIDNKKPPYFNDGDNLPIIDNYSDLNNLLNNKTHFKVNKKNLEKIRKKYFYKLDNKTYHRFWSKISRYA